jgi:hypothetical protein
MPPILLSPYERDLATVRKALGSERFDAARMTGSAMTLDQLVEYARQLDATAPPQPVVLATLSTNESAR